MPIKATSTTTGCVVPPSSPRTAAQGPEGLPLQMPGIGRKLGPFLRGTMLLPSHTTAIMNYHLTEDVLKTLAMNGLDTLTKGSELAQTVGNVLKTLASAPSANTPFELSHFPTNVYRLISNYVCTLFTTAAAAPSVNELQALIAFSNTPAAELRAAGRALPYLPDGKGAIIQDALTKLRFSNPANFAILTGSSAARDEKRLDLEEITNAVAQYPTLLNNKQFLSDVVLNMEGAMGGYTDAGMHRGAVDTAKLLGAAFTRNETNSEARNIITETFFGKEADLAKIAIGDALNGIKSLHVDAENLQDSLFAAAGENLFTRLNHYYLTLPDNVGNLDKLFSTEIAGALMARMTAAVNTKHPLQS